MTLADLHKAHVARRTQWQRDGKKQQEAVLRRQQAVEEKGKAEEKRLAAAEERRTQAIDQAIAEAYAKAYAKAGTAVAPVSFPWRKIATEIAVARGFTLADMQGPSHRKRISHCRQEVMYALKQGLSLEQIGRYLGGRHHTTILHGIRAHAERNGLPMPKGMK